MPFIKKNNIDFWIKNNQIVLDPNYLETNRQVFKKITGSRFASILGKSEYATPVKTWAIMTGLYREPMDQTLAKVGNVIEPMVRQYVENKTNQKYICYDPAKVNWDVFAENKIFGGIPDGEPIDENGKLLYPEKPMLEIKTTSIDAFVYKRQNGVLTMQKDESGIPLIKEEKKKYNSWFRNNKIFIPTEYMYQLGLYMYLRDVQSAIFAIAFLKKEDYAFPENFDVNNHEIKIVKMNVSLKEFNKEIEFATNWYEKHITTGFSPILSEEDKKWLIEQGIL